MSKRIWTRVAPIVALVLVLGGCERSANGAAAPERNAAVPAKIETKNSEPTAAKSATADTSAAPSGDSSMASSDAPPLAPITDYVLPGALAPDTGLEQLRQWFGAGNVQIDDHIAVPEGEELRGIVLYPKDSTRRAYLFFQNTQTLRGLSYVRISDRDTRWRLAPGVAMGMSLAELARLNGKPIRFSGLEWDYGGIVTDWNGGKIAGTGGDAVMRHARLGYTGSTYVGDNDYPTGDDGVSSDDKRYPKQGRLLTVIEFGVSFPGEDDL